MKKLLLILLFAVSFTAAAQENVLLRLYEGIDLESTNKTWKNYNDTYIKFYGDNCKIVLGNKEYYATFVNFEYATTERGTQTKIFNYRLIDGSPLAVQFFIGRNTLKLYTLAFNYQFNYFEVD